MSTQLFLALFLPALLLLTSCTSPSKLDLKLQFEQENATKRGISEKASPEIRSWRVSQEGSKASRACTRARPRAYAGTRKARACGTTGTGSKRTLVNPASRMPVFRRGRPGGSEEHIGGKVLMDYQELTENEAYVDRKFNRLAREVEILEDALRELFLRVQELEKAPRGPLPGQLPTEGTE